MSTPPGGPPPLRIGNQEREAAVKALDVHLEAGRLDPDEYGERYAKASMARTRGELDALFLDLPEPHASPMPQPLRWVPPVRKDWQRYLPASLIGRLVVVFVLVATLSVLIPVAAAGAIIWFVVIPILIGRGRQPRRRYRGTYRAAWHS